MKYPVLILDADYTPLSIESWQDAFKKIYCGDEVLYTVATYDKVVRDGRGNPYNLPAVVVHSKYIGRGSKRAAYSPGAVILRDNKTCQYCGRQLPKSRLNVDHIVPKSKPELLPHGIKLHSFENVICTCISCNSKKGDKTLKECKFHLIKQPRSMTKAELTTLRIRSRDYPIEWKPYIEHLPY